MHPGTVVEEVTEAEAAAEVVEEEAVVEVVVEEAVEAAGEV